MSKSVLNAEFKFLETIFDRNHERFRIIDQKPDKLSCQFSVTGDKLLTIHCNITESYPSTPAIWLVDSDDPSLAQVLKRLEDVSRGNNLLLQQLKKLICDLCQLYNLPQHPDLKMLDQPLPSAQDLKHRTTDEVTSEDVVKGEEVDKVYQNGTVMGQTKVMKPGTLDDLIETLHAIFESDNVNVADVKQIMESYESKPKDWNRYSNFDQYRYTRNLVYEGNKKFNLMILCWGKGHRSGIHDHPDSRCFMKMLEGELKETHFKLPECNSVMMQTSESILKENSVTYIDDSIGLHRVQNVSDTKCATSLHLYTPPFKTCHTFDQETGYKKTVKMTFWSKYGESCKNLLISGL